MHLGATLQLLEIQMNIEVSGTGLNLAPDAKIVSPRLPFYSVNGCGTKVIGRAFAPAKLSAYLGIYIRAVFVFVKGQLPKINQQAARVGKVCP